MIAAPTAVQNPEIVNPGTINATRPIMAALSTSRNSPSVMTVIGSVSTNATGRTTALTTPSRTAASRSWPFDVNCRPPSNWLATQRASAVMAARSRNPTMRGSFVRPRAGAGAADRG